MSHKEIQRGLTEAIINIILVREGVRPGALLFPPSQLTEKILDYARTEGLYVTPFRKRGKLYAGCGRIVWHDDCPNPDLFFVTHKQLPSGPFDEAEIATILGYHLTNYSFGQKNKFGVGFHEQHYDISVWGECYETVDLNELVQHGADIVLAANNVFKSLALPYHFKSQIKEY